MICKNNNHQDMKFNDKRTPFIPEEEPNNRYGICVKCGRYIQGHKLTLEVVKND